MAFLFWQKVAALALPLALSFPLSLYINVYTSTTTPSETAEAKTTEAGTAITIAIGHLFWHKVAAVSGIAAFGLFMFEPENQPYKDDWQKGILLHFIHTAALLVAPITKYPNIFGGLLTIGILAFSGMCYMAAYQSDNNYAYFCLMIGLFAFIGAWTSLLFLFYFILKAEKLFQNCIFNIL